MSKSKAVKREPVKNIEVVRETEKQTTKIIKQMASAKRVVAHPKGDRKILLNSTDDTQVRLLNSKELTFMGKSLSNFYSGLSGLQLPVPKYLFPEPHRNSSRLTYYATFFNSIEINSTFYKLPLTKTIRNWMAAVPEEFRFTFKLWRDITHVKELDFKESDVESFFNVISKANHKKGCVLIQFPPSLGSVQIMQLDALLRCIAQNNINHEWKIAVEFRNKSWYQQEVYELLRIYSAGLVIQDIPKSITPMIDHLSDFIYIRFHGPTGNYRDSYSEQFLTEYATYIKEWLEEGKTVYTYFNNTMGDAFKNLETLNQFILQDLKIT